MFKYFGPPIPESCRGILITHILDIAHVIHGHFDSVLFTYQAQVVLF